MYYNYLLVGSVAGVTPLLPVILIYQIILKFKYRISLTIWHVLGSVAFTVLMIGIFNITGLPSIYHMRWEPNVNGNPFVSFSNYPIQYYLNILLLVPFGFLLPLLWTKYRSVVRVTLCGFLLSLFIEMSQLFSYRATDIDDLIMNTLGAFLGYLIFKIFIFLFPKLSRHFSSTRKDMKPINREAFLYITLAWVMVCVVQPFFWR